MTTYALHTIERVMDATPDEVYDAFLERDALPEWFQLEPGWDVDVLAYDTSVGGTTIVEFGDPAVGWSCREDMTFRELVRGERIVYDLRFTSKGPDGDTAVFDTVVTIVLVAQDGKTVLSLDETGYPNDEVREMHQNGWPGYLAKLEEVAIARSTS